MDMTATATAMLEPVPAHATCGIRVVRAGDGRAEVRLVVEPQLTNVIGSLHSSGLIALVDATALAAMIAMADDPAQFELVTPLGTAAEIEFVAPARGQLTGSCELTPQARTRITALLRGEVRKATIVTDTEVADEDGTAVCHGTFTWKLRRAPAASGRLGLRPGAAGPQP